jgi:hypothetical protein
MIGSEEFRNHIGGIHTKPANTAAASQKNSRLWLERRLPRKDMII